MIPALAFNEAKATVFSDARSVSESDITSYLGMRDFKDTHQAADFQFKISYLEINELLIGTMSSNGVFFERSVNPTCELILPLDGEWLVESSGSSTRFDPKGKAFFHTYDQKKQATAGSGLILDLHFEKLDRICATLLGVEATKIFSSNPQSPSLRVGDISFSDLFQSLCIQIDAAGANPRVLQRLALDDSFYRLCIGLLYPDIFLAEEPGDGKRSDVRPELTKLCEFLAAHLADPISLTQMEQISGLSARVLQRSFQKAFGLRPKQWVRKQRLHAARSAMLNPHEHSTITSIAYDFCFASPSEFARHYLAEFGELPSKTLARK